MTDAHSMTDQKRVSLALDFFETCTTPQALYAAWERTTALRDNLKAKYDAGDHDAWENAKRLERGRVRCRFQMAVVA
jgi:hypothetical protein